MRGIQVPAAAAVMALAAAGSASAGVIFSEDFSGATPGNQGGVIGGSQFTVTGSNVDVVGVLNGSFFTCVDNPAGNCLDLVGASGGGQIAANPVFNLVAGRTYGLTFGEVVQGYSPGDAAFTTFSVSLGDMTQTFTAPGGVVTPYALIFTPLADQLGAKLVFTTLVPADSVHGAVIDNIVLSETGGAVGVPEPAAWALMLAGFGVSGVALRRRRLSLA